MAALVWEPTVKLQVRHLVSAGWVVRRPKGVRYADTFSVVIPVCGDSVDWEVCFDASRPWLAPDLVLRPPGFSPLGAQGSRVPGLLASWDVSDEGALTRVLSAVLDEFNEWQARSVRENADERLAMELATLDGLEGLQCALLPAPGAPDLKRAVLSVPFGADALAVLATAIQLRAEREGGVQGQETTAALQAAARATGANAWPQLTRLNAAMDVRKQGSSDAPPAPQSRLVLHASAPQPVRSALLDFKLPDWPEGSMFVEYVASAEAKLAEFAQTALHRAETGAPASVGDVAAQDGLTQALKTFYQLADVQPPYPGDGGARVVFQYTADDGTDLLVRVVYPEPFPHAPPQFTLVNVPGGRAVFPPGGFALPSPPWSPRWPYDEAAGRVFQWFTTEAEKAIKDAPKQKGRGWGKVFGGGGTSNAGGADAGASGGIMGEYPALGGASAVPATGAAGAWGSGRAGLPASVVQAGAGQAGAGAGAARTGAEQRRQSAEEDITDILS